MILILGGTTEGRRAAEVLEEAGKPFYYSTKTGEQDITLHHGRRTDGAMDADGMRQFCQEHGIRLLVDAAHPFAQQLHQAIQSAGITTKTLCETSHADMVSQLAEEGLGIGFASTTSHNCPEACRAIPLAEPITRTIYYVTLKELLDYPTVQSFTNYVEHYTFRN